MIVDLQHTSGAVPVTSADVCVIGAGAAGITMAIELSRLGHSVLLLEGGGLKIENGSQQMYQSEIVGLPHSGVHEGRFRVLGGTTTRWGGQILELDASDFEARAWVPESGWPIAKAVLTRYYRRALQIEGVASSLLEDEDVWRAVGGKRPFLGPGLESLLTRFCPQPNFAKLHWSFLKTQRDVTVCLNASLCEIVLSDSQDAIRAVLCRTYGRPDSVFRAQHFVFCLGGLETARVLMQPLRNLNSAPWNRGDKLGRYFQDHLDISAATMFPMDSNDFHLHFDNIYLKRFRYIPKIKASARLQEELGILSVGASFVAQSTRQEVVEEFRRTLLSYQRGEQRRFGKQQLLQAAKAADILFRKAWRYFRHRRAYNPDDLGVDLRVHCEQAPNANSRVRLSPARDATGLLKLRLDWQFGELELVTIRKFVDHAARAFENSGFAKVKIQSQRLECVQILASNTSDAYHHMGTTRMAHAAGDGVVDPNCQLFGISNGFVCSSSVFPSSGFSNPTHTILALGVRLAEFISQRMAR